MQDIIFGSEGTAQADFERMEEINREIGLTALIRNLGGGSSNPDITESEKPENKELL